jgi:hypothetical protein
MKFCRKGTVFPRIRAQMSIVEGLLGPLANDMPYTPYTDSTLHRLADLKPQTLALMHGSSFRGDGALQFWISPE